MFKTILICALLLVMAIAIPTRRKRDGEEQVSPTKRPTRGILSRFLSNFMQRRLARIVNRNQERRTPMMKLIHDFIASRMYAIGKIERNGTIPLPTLEPTTISFEEAMAKIALEMLRRRAEEQGKIFNLTFKRKRRDDNGNNSKKKS